MTKSAIEALNDVTKMLIDSLEGYRKSVEVADEHHGHKAEFQQRADIRADLIADFQFRVRALGGEAETEGGVLAALHRGTMDIMSLFRDDKEAALAAIDDGEEQLAEKIESELENNDLDQETRALLQKAHASARNGERFADRAQGDS